MDWTSILTALIAALVPTGGLLAIVTMTEKKSALMLQNAKELAESYKVLAEEYQEREAKTQKLLEEKEEELMTQIKMNSSLRHSLDDSHTREAVCKLMFCKRTQCVDRDPPFGSHAGDIMDEMHDTSRNDYNGTPENNRYGKRGKRGSDNAAD
jgi:hypothetical protein